MENKYLSLGKNDIVKGFIMAVLAAIMTAVYASIQSNELLFTWLYFKPIIINAIGAGIAYLLKNFFTNSNDQFFKKEIINTPPSNEIKVDQINQNIVEPNANITNNPV